MMSETIQDFLDEYQEDTRMKRILKLVTKKFTQQLLETQERNTEKTKAELMRFAQENFQEILADRMLKLTENKNSVRLVPPRNARLCGYCGKWLSTTLEDFETHVAGHGIQSQLSSAPPPPKPMLTKPFKCNIVGFNKRFARKANLKQHGLIHTGEKPFKCKVCKKRFTQKGHLRRHEMIQSGVKPFRCTVCRKKFSQSGNLNVHLRIHSGIRPFKCRHCAMRFTTSSNLARHVRRLHTGHKPFACEECVKKFTTSSHLTLHRRVHSGEKPFKCHQCDKQFSDPSNLTVHLRVHTGECPFRCTICDKTFSHKCTMIRQQKKHSSP